MSWVARWFARRALYAEERSLKKHEQLWAGLKVLGLLTLLILSVLFLWSFVPHLLHTPRCAQMGTC